MLDEAGVALENPPQTVTQRILKPSEITDDMLISLGIVNLVKSGYELDLSDEELMKRVRLEMGNGNDAFRVLLMVDSEERAVGSLRMSKWTPDGGDSRGRLYWNALNRINPAHAAERTHYVAGIVVDPAYQGSGIAKELLENTYKGDLLGEVPDVVLAQSKSLAAIIRGGKIARTHGFRTFVGQHEITGQQLSKVGDNSDRLKAYYATSLGQQGDYLEVPRNMLNPALPSLATVPAYLQPAFAGLIDAQHNNQTKTLQFPLISVKK